MVSIGYHDVGEEWSQKLAWRRDLITRETEVDVLLFDDSVDSLDDTSDVSDITTELSGGQYARQTVNLDSGDVSLSVSGGNLRVSGTVTFDIDGTSGSFDSYGLVNEFTSDIVNNETTPNPHLIATAILDGGPYDAANFSAFGVQFRGDLD